MEALFTTEPLDDFKLVLQEVFNRLRKSNKNLKSIDNSNTISAATQEIKQLIIDCNFDLDEVAAVARRKTWDQDKIEHFVTKLQESRIDLLYALLTHSISSYGESVINFNWVLKLVLGSSELKSLKYPLLQLMLHTESSDGQKDQKLYELNKEALHKLINVLENVQ